MIQRARFAHRRWVLNAVAALACLVVATVATAQLTAENGKVYKPVWPNNGIAQRKAPGAYNMFIERGHDGKWHAWVLFGNNPNPEDAEAMDFFTGRVMKVTAQVDPDTQQQMPFFTDPQGNFHGPLGQDFESQRGLPYGITIDAHDSLAGRLSLPANPCFVPMAFNGGGIQVDSHPAWSKVPLDLLRPTRRSVCADGQYGTSFLSTLDLGDGTFLITMNCWVFRLRGSDLMPVGEAPGLRVVDTAAVVKAIAVAKRLRKTKQLPYITQALHLDINPANSCR